MSPEEARDKNVADLLGSAADSLASARSEHAAGWLRFAVNRAYYACSYAASAVLLAEGRHFVKHTGVRAAVHQHMVKTARLSPIHGQTSDALFEARHEADDGASVTFKPDDVAQRITRAERFVEALKQMAPRADGNST
jgi:uncharacterized protein (UPF0332 family)